VGRARATVKTGGRTVTAERRDSTRTHKPQSLFSSFPLFLRPQILRPNAPHVPVRRLPPALLLAEIAAPFLMDGGCSAHKRHVFFLCPGRVQDPTSSGKSMTTVTIVSDYPSFDRDWKQGLCGCVDDPGTCKASATWVRRLSVRMHGARRAFLVNISVGPRPSGGPKPLPIPPVNPLAVSQASRPLLTSDHPQFPRESLANKHTLCITGLTACFCFHCTMGHVGHFTGGSWPVACLCAIPFPHCVACILRGRYGRLCMPHQVIKYVPLLLCSFVYSTESPFMHPLPPLRRLRPPRQVGSFAAVDTFVCSTSHFYASRRPILSLCMPHQIIRGPYSPSLLSLRIDAFSGGSIAMMSHRLRDQLNIRGGPVADLVATGCCLPCAACQMRREVRHKC
jgi:hypothetical protein